MSKCECEHWVYLHDEDGACRVCNCVELRCVEKRRVVVTA